MFGLLAGLGSWAHAAQPAYDLRIVLENSTAMQAGDEQGFRQAALKLLVEQLPQGSRAGFWSYDEVTQEVVAYGPIDRMWRQLAGIHAGHLTTVRSGRNLSRALEHATFDYADVDRGPVHILLLSSGVDDQGLSETEQSIHRQRFLATWASELRSARIVVHAIAFDGGGDNDHDLLRQLTAISGGQFVEPTSLQTVQEFILGLINLPAPQTQALVDATGRFQVAPGTQSMNLLWLHPASAEGSDLDAVSLVAPDGTVLDAVRGIPQGRWLRTTGFDMMRLERPQPGWWRLRGVPAAQINLVGDLEVQVIGLEQTLIPAQDGHVMIHLFANGVRVQNSEFLSLLDVRAWVETDGARAPVPVEAQGDGYAAYLLDLADGAHQFEVQVAAPSFRHRVVLPFAVSNPLRVSLKTDDQGMLQAWVQFNHPEVDYTSLSIVGKVRTPPEVAQLVPASVYPGGLWQVPISDRDGIVEVGFSVSGNQLNGKGFFMKTRSQTLSLPITDPELTVMRFDAKGQRLKALSGAEEIEENAHLGTHSFDGVSAGASAAATLGVAPVGEGTNPGTAVSPESTGVQLPLWFFGVITALNLLIAVTLWFLYKPAPLPFDTSELDAAEAAPA